MEKTQRKLILISVIAVMILSVVGMAIADPVGSGTLNPTSSSRGTDASAGQLNAQGGNVTNVDITAQSITTKWAGFYGDVTGSVSLENGAGAVFYNWSSASPSGEVFATRDNNPTWSGITCADAAEVTAEATALSLDQGMDNITNTYCTTCGNHSAFDVGGSSFTDNECTYRTNAFDDTGNQDVNWDQILLHEGTDIVYTTIINQDTTGFDGSTYDFQLLVGENASTSVLTNYYFYVEIA